jgi:hypothetical protein
MESNNPTSLNKRGDFWKEFLAEAGLLDSEFIARETLKALIKSIS